MGDDSGVVEISPNGDIILVVGKEEPVRLSVSSIILRSASKPFDAMLSPPWSESSSKQVTLREDDIEAIKAICYAIHHRPDMIPLDNLTGKQILQAVRVIDKYDLSTAMKLVTDRWLRQNLRAKSVEDLLYMAAAATILKNYEAFSKLTWLAMISHKGSYLRFQNDDELRESLPQGTIFLLVERSFLIRAHFFAALQEIEVADECKCDCAKIMRSAVKSVQDSHNSGSKQTRKILESLEAMIKLDHAQEHFESTSRDCGCKNYHYFKNCRADYLGEKLPDWAYSATSLCLQCLEEDANMEPACKHKKTPKRSYSWVTDAEFERLFMF